MKNTFLHKKPTIFALALIFFAGAFLFGRSVSYDFVYDDEWTIVRNDALNSLSPPSKFFIDPKTAAYPPSGIGSDVYRPLPTLSFALNKKLTGENPAGFRIPNLLIHFINALLIFLILKRKLDLAPALGGALLFLCHPVQVESAVWITQRSILMCGLFLFLSSLFYLDRTRDSWRAWAATAIFIPAFLSKEAALVFPFVILAAHAARRTRPHPAAWTMATLAPLLFFFRQMVMGKPFQSVGSLSLAERVKDGVTALGLYAENLLWPVNLSVSYPSPGMGEIRPDFWLGALFFVLLAAGSIFLVLRRSSWALIPVWFLFFWAPHSGIIPTVTFAADRFLYLPMAAFAAGFGFLIQKSPFKRGSLAVLICFSILTVQQTGVWASNLVLWEKTARVNPTAPFPRAVFAQALMKEGRTDEAIAEFEKALSLNPKPSFGRSVSILLSRLYREKGNDAAAKQVLEEAEDRFRLPSTEIKNHSDN